MAVKRTSNLSSTISNLDRKIKTLESSTTGIASTSTAVTTTTTPDDEGFSSGTNISATNAPYTYKKVVEAYIYGPKVTGNTSRAELYFEEDPGVPQAGYVEVQGIHGNTANDIDISGKFKVYALDEDPWDDDVRATQPWRDEPGASITNTIWYNPVVTPPANSPTDQGLQLITTRLIDSVSASGTTVTVTLNSAHRFEAGDVLYFDLPNSLLDGYTDKLFQVSNVVDSTTIEYELESSLGSPISLNSGDLGTVYVYPVAHEYVADGTLWTDTSVEPNKVYIWKGYRWYDTTDAAVAESGGADTVAPSPVSNLQATSAVTEVYGPDTNGKSSVTLTWDAPTTNENSTTLEDLGGYSVWWRYNASQAWRITEIDDPDTTTWIGEDFVYNVTVLFAVYAKDKFGNRSTATTTSITTSATPAASIGTPSAPTVTGYLGTMKVYWDGLNSIGGAITETSGVFEIELHISATNNFTPSSSTLFERFPAINGPTYTVIPGNAEIEGSAIVDGQTYYFKFGFIDIWGNTSTYSAQGSFVGQLSDIVTFDQIDVGTITGEILVGADIRTSANPSVNGGIALDSSGITAYDAGGSQTFNISAATGAVTIGNYLTSSTAASTYLSISNASGTYLTQSNAASTYLTQLTAQGLYLTQTDASNTYLTEIGAGTLFISKGGAAGDINSNATTIDGGKITTGTLLANTIGSGTLPVGVVYAGTISADNITSGVITGSSIQTASSGKRILLSRTSNSAVFYDDSGTLVGRVQGVTAGGGSLDLVGRGTASINIGIASTTVDGNLATSGSANIVAAGRCGQVTFTSLGTTTAVGRDSTTLLFGPSSSDERLKENIVELEDSLSLLNQLRPVKFTFKSEENGPVSYGLIAQEVQPFFDANDNIVNVMDGEEGYLSLEYTGFVSQLIRAVQQLSEKNTELEARIATLEGTT